jgi:hypothetical protein
MDETPKPSDQLPEEQPAEAVPDDVDESDEAESSEERVGRPHGDHDDRTPATGSPADDTDGD